MPPLPLHPKDIDFSIQARHILHLSVVEVEGLEVELVRRRDRTTKVWKTVREYKKADLFIPGGVIPGVPQQSLDFKVSRIVEKAARGPRNNLQIKRTPTALKETIEAWTWRCLTSAMGDAFNNKAKEYQNVTPLNGQGIINTTYIIFSTGGMPHKDAKLWLKSLPPGLRQAVRYAISFTLLKHNVRSVDACLSMNR